MAKEERLSASASAAGVVSGAVGGMVAGAKRGPAGMAVGALAGALKGLDAQAQGGTTTKDEVGRSQRMTAAQSAEQGRMIEQATQALNSLDGSKMTEGQRMARNDLVSQLNNLKQASDDRTAALQDEEKAGREWSRQSQRAVTMAANPDNTAGITDPAQMAKLQEAASNGDLGQVLQALGSTQQAATQNPAAQQFLADAANSPQAPGPIKTPEQLGNDGAAAVAAASAANRGVVAKQNAANNSQVDQKAAAAGIDANNPSAAAYLAFAQVARAAAEGKVDAATAAKAESYKGETMANVPKAMAAFSDAAPFGSDARSLKEFLNKPAVTNEGGRFSVNEPLIQRQAEVGAAAARLASNFDRGDFKSGAKLSPETRQQIDADKATLKAAAK